MLRAVNFESWRTSRHKEEFWQGEGIRGPTLKHAISDVVVARGHAGTVIKNRANIYLYAQTNRECLQVGAVRLVHGLDAAFIVLLVRACKKLSHVGEEVMLHPQHCSLR